YTTLFRSSNGCSRLLLHRRFQASSSLEACPPASSVTRPNQVHLRYSSHLRLPRLHGIGHPMLMLGRLHVEQAIHMAASFHAARSIRLPGTPKAQSTRREEAEDRVCSRGFSPDEDTLAAARRRGEDEK